MLKCSEKAFAKCPSRHLCGMRADATFTEGSECDAFNREVEGKPMTNADRIRTMSDEELAKWLCEFDAEAFAAGVLKYGAPIMNERERLDWLRQPAEEFTPRPVIIARTAERSECQKRPKFFQYFF